MTVSSSTNRVSYSGNGSLTTFAYTFKVFDQDDLTVILRASNGTETVQTITTHYTVTNVGDASGGNIEFVTAPSATETVVIVREQPFTQGLDLVPNDPFPAQSLEESLDKLTFVDQRLNEKIDRALTFSVGDFVTDATLPVKELRVGKVLAFNETTGNPEAGPSIADTESIANISADIATLADIQDGTVATNAITNVNTIRTDVTTVSGISSDVTTVSTNNANVTTVATDLGGSDTIGTVAGSISNVNTVATDISNVNTTATNIADVNTVAGEIGVSGVVTIVANAITDVSTVSSDIAAVITAANDLNEAVSEIDTVANAITNVDTVGTNIANVNTVAGISSDVTTVAADGTDIGTVATNITNVNTVAGISGNVTTVAGISADVTTVAADGTDIGTVAGISSDVTTVSGISANVTTVAGISANVTTVAGISANVTTVAGDTTNIGTIATNLNGADTIGTVAGSISNVNSVGGAISDVSTVASNLTDVQSFANTYRIGTTDPTTSLDTGDLFFNTSSGVLKVYNGSAWEAGVTAGSGFLPLTGGTMTGALDVQSTVTADGLTVDGNVNISDSTPVFTMTDTDGGSANMAVYTGSLVISADSANEYTTRVLQLGVGDKSYFNLDDNGDISFREETGTTAKFFWDASAERLGIGTASPTYALHTLSSSGAVGILESTSGSSTLYLKNSGSTYAYSVGVSSSSNDLRFLTGDGSERVRIDSSGNVGIGTTSPSRQLHLSGSTPIIRLTDTDTNAYGEISSSSSDGNLMFYADQGNTQANTTIRFYVDTAERMRIDSSGILLVGATSSNSANVGHGFNPNGFTYHTRDDGEVLRLNRKTSDGDIVTFRKDGTTVGSVRSESGDIVFGNDTRGLKFRDTDVIPRDMDNTTADGVVSLGSSTSRFKDLYLSGGVVETTTTVTYASSIALTYDNGSIQTVTLTGNVTFTDSLADGEAIVLMLNAGASHTVTWTIVDKWVSSSGNAAPTLTANDTIVLWKIGTTVYAAYAGSYT